METNLDRDDRALLALKEQMTEQQCQEMAELLQNELRRRSMLKMESANRMPREKSKVRSSQISGGLDADSLGDIYSNVSRESQQLKLMKLEHKLEQAREQQRKYGKYVAKSRGKSLRDRFLSKKTPRRERVDLETLLQRELGNSSKELLAGSASNEMNFPSAASAQRKPELKNVAIVAGVVLLAVAKVVFSNGVVDATIDNQQEMAPAALVAAVAGSEQFAVTKKQAELGQQPATNNSLAGNADRRLVGWSPSEKKILNDLDARRVELERRKSALERKEQELAQQSRVISERLAELRGLNSKISEVRKDKDRRYESRMEQLSQVYGSMAPKEAAPLISKLGDDIALALLQRMTGKRMGQILSVMDQQRAIDLTQLLTNKQEL